ncbi:MAG TPA: chemotaxis protein CheW [Blastocatellia bacterium]
MIQVTGITGATELGDGRVVLILDAAALVKQSAAASGLS